jgi:hypothetical protein
MSNNGAWGLLVYTGLHIFVRMGALDAGHGSILPYLSLIVLVGAIIPACRWVEKRWEVLGDEGASDAPPVVGGAADGAPADGVVVVPPPLHAATMIAAIARRTAI